MKHLGNQSTLLQLPKLHCHREFVAHAEMFKVSEEKVVTGSQFWTVALRSHISLQQPAMCVTFVRVPCHEAEGQQSTTSHGVSV